MTEEEQPERNTDHVVLCTLTSAFKCLHCGAQYQMNLPCPLSLFAVACKEFANIHAGCTEKPKEAPQKAPPQEQPLPPPQPQTPAIPEGRTHLTTAEFSRLINRTEQTLRKNYCYTGECHGIRPMKLGSRLHWPVDEIKKLLDNRKIDSSTRQHLTQTKGKTPNDKPD